MEEKPKAQKPKIGKDVAEADFARFVAAMRLNLSMDGMDAEDRTTLDQQKRRIIDAILAGSLVISEKGVPTFTPQDSENRDPIRFPRPKGADLMAADYVKKGHEIEKSFAIMASATRNPVGRYADMESSDLFVCQAIVNLYMGG